MFRGEVVERSWADRLPGLVLGLLVLGVTVYALARVRGRWRYALVALLVVEAWLVGRSLVP